MPDHVTSMSRLLVTSVSFAFLTTFVAVVAFAPTASATNVCTQNTDEAVWDPSHQSYTHTINRECVLYQDGSRTCVLYKYHYYYHAAYFNGEWHETGPYETETYGACVKPSTIGA